MHPEVESNFCAIYTRATEATRGGGGRFLSGILRRPRVRWHESKVWPEMPNRPPARDLARFSSIRQARAA